MEPVLKKIKRDDTGGLILKISGNKIDNMTLSIGKLIRIHNNNTNYTDKERIDE